MKLSGEIIGLLLIVLIMSCFALPFFVLLREVVVFFWVEWVYPVVAAEFCLMTIYFGFFEKDKK